MIKKIFLILLFMSTLNVALLAQWTQLSSGTTNTLNAVFFPTTDTGYVVGDLGTILKTTDGGINWIAQTGVTSTLSLNAVFFIDANYGFAVGGPDLTGNILKTIDGGNNWTLSNPGPSMLNDIFFTNDSTGYITGLGNGNIYITNDSGNTWAQQPCGATGSVYFTSNDTGYVLGSTSILKTTDKGINWVRCIFMGSIYFKQKDFAI